MVKHVRDDAVTMMVSGLCFGRDCHTLFMTLALSLSVL